MALTKISTGMLKQDAASSDLNIDAGTLYLDVSNNRVGIATTSPGYTLDVAAGSAIAARFTGGDSNGITSIFTRASEQGLKTWSGNSYYSGLVAGAHFQIFTNNSPSTPRVTVLDTGKVGIGITDPATNLHISSTDGSTLTIQNSTNAGNASLHFRDESNADSYKIFYNLPSNIAEQHFNGNGIRFYSTQTSAEVAKIGFGNNYNTSYFAGRVGAGTSSPAYPVEISGEGTVSLAYQRTGTGVTAKKWGFHSDNANTYWQNITDSVLAITVANAGNVGIGTTSPQVDFHVNDSSGGVAMLTRTSGSTSGTLGILRFGNENIDSNLVEIVGVQDGATDSGRLEFKVQSTAAATVTRMTVKSDGKVGIGTVSPDALLHISATSPHIDIGPQGGNRGKIGYHDLDVIIGSTSSTGEIHFKNNIGSTDAPHSSGDTKMVITDSNVGIGTSSPSSKLHLRDTSNDIELRFEPQSQANYPKLVGGSAAGTNDTYFAVDFVTRGEALRVDGETGNVGIGTTDPGNKLHVKAGTSGATTFDSRHNLTLEDDGENYLGFYTPNNSFSGLRFVNADSSIRAHIDYYHGTQGDKFVMYSQEGWEFTYPSYGVQQVLKKNGNVGIRATNPPHDLTIYNASGPTLYLVGGGYNDDVMIAFGGGDTTNTTSNGNTGAQIISTQSALNGQARGDLRFLTNQGDSLQTRLVIEEAGNVGINNSNPDGLLSLSKGTRTLDLKLETTPATGDVGVQFRANSGAYLGLAAGGGTGIGIVVDSSNKVGIGTIDPMSPLVVKKNGVNEGTLSFDDENNNAHLTLEGADARVRMQMGTYNNGSYGVYIQGSYDNNASGTGSSGTEPIILNPQGGYVGVGTTTPVTTLHVAGADGLAYLKLTSDSTGHTASDGSRIGLNGSDLRIINAEAATLSLHTSNTQRMVIRSDGELRLGTGGIERPFAKITNWGYSASYRVLMLGSASTTYSDAGTGSTTISMGYDPSGNADGSFTGDGREILFRRGAQFVTPNSADDDFYLYNLVLRDGNVGINENNPQFKLEVKNVGGDAINIKAGNDFSGLRLSSDNGAWSVRTSTADALIFYDVSSSSEVGRFDSSGRLLVGKQTSNYATEGVEIRSNEILITKSTTNPLSVRNGANGGLISLNSSGSTVGGIGAYGGTTYYAGNSHALMINGTSVEPSNNSGGRVNNTVDLGSSTYKFKDLNLAGKILVGDNGDYEDTGDNFNGGIVFQTPLYTEYQWKWNGLDDHETNLYCGSYFMAEIVFTQHQTNSGTDINRHLLAKWANNHTHHELETIHDSGSTWSMTTSITATDHNLLATGASGTGAHGRLRIVETYGSGSYSFSTLTVRVYQGTLSNVTHTYG